jgi:hypothetical protein
VPSSGNWGKRGKNVQAAITDAHRAMNKSGVGINSHKNGFWGFPGHGGTHTDKYLLRMGKVLRGKTSAGEVERGLKQLWKELKRGDFL